MKNDFIEYKDNKSSITLTTIISLFFLIATILLITQAESYSFSAVYLGLLFLIILSISIVEFMSEGKSSILNANFFGIKKEQIYVALFAGLLLGGLLGMLAKGGQTILGQTLYLPIQSLTAFSYLGDFFPVEVAPVGEPLFFRAILLPSSIAIFWALFRNSSVKFLRNEAFAVVLGILFTGYLFGVFHFNVFLNQTGFNLVLANDYILMAVLFSVIWSLGVRGFQCIAFEIGWHKINNLVAMGYSNEMIIVNLVIWLVIAVMLIEFAYRNKR